MQSRQDLRNLIGQRGMDHQERPVENSCKWYVPFLVVILAMAGFLVAADSNAQTVGDPESEEEEISAEEAALLAGENNPALIPLSDNNGRRLGYANRPSCQIFIVDPGRLGASIENTSLDSKLMNGRPGTVQVFARTGNYRLSIDPPLGFSASPVGGSTAVVMRATFSGQGKTNFSERDGNTAIRLRRGLTTIRTHLTASRTDGNPFPPGNYSAEVTMRCE